MNYYEMRKQFGRSPRLSAVLIWATQKALKGYDVKHPDSKRQRNRRLRAKELRQARELKRTGLLRLISL